MSSYASQVQHLRFNAATQRFEALVVFHEDGETIKYPTTLPLPIQSDFAVVTQKLVAAAKKQRHQSAGSLVSRTATGQLRLSNLGDLARQMLHGLKVAKGPSAA